MCQWFESLTIRGLCVWVIFGYWCNAMTAADISCTISDSANCCHHLDCDWLLHRHSGTPSHPKTVSHGMFLPSSYSSYTFDKFLMLEKQSGTSNKCQEYWVGCVALCKMFPMIKKTYMSRFLLYNFSIHFQSANHPFYWNCFSVIQLLDI